MMTLDELKLVKELVAVSENCADAGNDGSSSNRRFNRLRAQQQVLMERLEDCACFHDWRTLFKMKNGDDFNQCNICGSRRILAAKQPAEPSSEGE